VKKSKIKRGELKADARRHTDASVSRTTDVSVSRTTDAMVRRIFWLRGAKGEGTKRLASHLFKTKIFSLPFTIIGNSIN